MTEYRVVMTAIGVLCALGAASSLWPVIDVVMTAALLGGLGLAALTAAARTVVGEILLRREIRAAAPVPAPICSRVEISA